MNIHPGSGQLAAALCPRGITSRGSEERGGAEFLKQTKIQQQRQPILIPAKKIAGIDVSMDQSLAMENA
jgi:hypothetical protein